MDILESLQNLGLNLDSVRNISISSDYTVYIGRPSKWGNPVFLKDRSCELERVKVLIDYCNYLKERDDLLDLIDKELSGKKLGCYCSPLLCHGFVLSILSNKQDKKKAIEDILDILIAFLKEKAGWKTVLE